MPVLYFFFRQIVDSNHTPRAALQDWLVQILDYSPLLRSNLSAYLEPGKQDRQPQTSEARELSSLSIVDLWQHLRTALFQLGRAYIIVDAMDEMDHTQDTDSFLHQLSDLAQWRPSHVKVLVTSRPSADIQRTLRHQTMLHLRLDEEHVDVDITRYVRSSIATSSISVENYEAIEAAVPGQAKGLFLYAKLAMNVLLEHGMNIQEALRLLPANLDLMYCRLLHEHQKRTGTSCETQILTMQWITHSIRPLRLIELSDMLVHQGSSAIETLGEAKSYVRSACGSLLELLHDETLSVVHHSLTEFLRGGKRVVPDQYPVLTAGSTHLRLALICLSYLQNGCLEAVEQRDNTHTQFMWPGQHKKPVLPPFTRYAALHWHIHARRCSIEGIDLTELHQSLDKFTAHGHFQRWVQLAKSHLDTTRTITPLALAIQLGLSDYVKLLLSSPDTDCNVGAPITWAADKGFADVVSLLIQHGANVDQLDHRGYTALHRAAIKNHSAVVKLLLDAGCKMQKRTSTKPIDPGFRSGHTQHSALWYACTYGHFETVKELSSHIKTAEEITKALGYAVENKRFAIVQHLLMHPLIHLAEAQAKSLMWKACFKRQADIIELLLSTSIDGTEGYLRALAGSKEAVSVEDTRKCFKLLLDAGANPNALETDPTSAEFLFSTNSQAETPLHHAADKIAAEILVEAGAHVGARNGRQETPLHTCTNMEVVEFLIKTGKANLEMMDCWGQTPLIASFGSLGTQKSSRDLMRLVDLGADVNAIDKDGNGVYHLSMDLRYRNDDSLQTLIEHFRAAGADIDRCNRKGEAPIHLTKIERGQTYPPPPYERPSNFEILVAAGASLTPASADVSKTPMFAWISKSICEHNQDLPMILDILLKAGGSLNITDDRGRSLLHDAVLAPPERMRIAFLIEHGLDPNVLDNDGNNLWHEATKVSERYNYDDWGNDPEPFTQLSQLGLDATRPNHQGRTALHVLTSSWKEDSFHYRRSNMPLGKRTAFDLILSLFPDLDVMDNDGVTPLHIASTFSEFLVRKFLQGNADPRRATKDSLNAVHVAARSANPNILGILLEHLQSDHKVDLDAIINAKDNSGRTPLFYASLVGSYECAKYLLAAGATIECQHYQNSPWKGLADFESEMGTWKFEYGREANCVLLIEEPRSTHSGEWRWHSRIDELGALLAKNATSLPDFLDRAIADAAINKSDYTVEYLLRVRRLATPLAKELVGIDAVSESLERRQIRRRKHFQNEPCESCKQVHEHVQSALDIAQRMRDYHLLPEILLEETSESISRVVSSLVSGGYASALQGIIDSLGVRTWQAFAGEDANISTRDDKNGKIASLLQSASMRQISNMDIIKLLVEQYAFNLDAQTPILTSQPNDSWQWQSNQNATLVQGDSMMHNLVRGERWWQIHEALPYLLERGANTELRNAHGETPLSTALNKCGWRTFDRHGVQLLVQHGANVNATDSAKRTCLAKACSNMEMVELLLDHGAVVSNDVFQQAIQSRNAGLLELLLSRGADPNICESAVNLTLSRFHRIPHGNMYPLHYLMSPNQHRMDDETYRRMVEIMLQHGADPCAEYPGTTILHELIRENIDLNPLFDDANVRLNLESRDSERQTALLVLSQRNSSPDKTKQHNTAGRSTLALLISRRADIRARDSKGNSIVHYFAEGNWNLEYDDMVSIVQQAPELINHFNVEGSTPLHVAMRSAFGFPQTVDLLLENGGDIYAVDGEGNTMLHLLVGQRWTVDDRGRLTGTVFNIFNQLLRRGMDVSARNNAGETVFYSFLRGGSVILNNNYAAHGRPEASEAPVYDFFDEHEVDWQALNAQGQNMLHVVASSIEGRQLAEKRFKRLLDLGLDAGLEDKASRTPLDYAADLGLQDVLQLFQKK